MPGVIGSTKHSPFVASNDSSDVTVDIGGVELLVFHRMLGNPAGFMIAKADPDSRKTVEPRA